MHDYARHNFSRTFDNKPLTPANDPAHNALVSGIGTRGDESFFPDVVAKMTRFNKTARNLRRPIPSPEKFVRTILAERFRNAAELQDVEINAFNLCNQFLGENTQLIHSLFSLVMNRIQFCTNASETVFPIFAEKLDTFIAEHILGETIDETTTSVSKTLQS